MRNVKTVVRRKKLFIVIDLMKELDITTRFGNSMVSTSDNWTKIPGMDGWSFNMVLTKKPGAETPEDSSNADQADLLTEVLGPRPLTSGAGAAVKAG